MALFGKAFLIFFLVCLNGFFVAAEFALVKVRRSRIEELKEQGVFTAKISSRILDELDAYLSGCQVGITLASLALGWVGEPFIADQLEPLIRSFGVQSDKVLHTIAFAVAFGIITYLHIVAGEMAPKSLSIRLAEKTTLWTALPLFLFYTTLRPFIFVLNSSALLLLRLFGVNAASDSDMAHSQEELRHILEHSAKSGQLTGRAAEIMDNVLSLHDKSAKQIMIPRTAVAFLSTTNTFSENLRITRETQHTRYPLCDADLDNIAGIVHIKDVLAATTDGEKGLRMKKLKRDVIFYPETISLDALFREFQRTKLHLAVLVDEYGGTTGIVTLEDVLEELVGEIYDEFDQPVALIRRVGRREYLIEGLCPVKMCEEQLNIKFPDFDVETVGGVIFSIAGHIPEAGSVLKLDFGRIVVEQIDRQRIAKVRLILSAEKPEGIINQPDQT
ncbi:hemolysin family protein, partial [bacterium]|nr:hemolysin family protein [bacterium]